MSLEIGAQPRFATPAALANGAGRGAYTVVGGVLTWDPRFDSVPAGQIRLRRGGYARLGSVRAAVDFYATVVDLRAELNRLHAHFARGAGPAWRFGQAVPPEADDVLTVLVNGEIQWGTSMRILGRLYRAANLPASARPPSAARAGIDLRLIRFTGRADPFSRGVDTWLDFPRAASWEALGSEVIARWMSAYPERSRLPLSDSRVLAQDLQRQADELATMGILLPWYALLVIVIVGIGAAAVVANRAIGAGAAFLGVNVDYLSQLNDQLAELWESCQEGNDRACDLWPEVAARIEGMDLPLTGIARMGLLGAFILGGIWLVGR